MTTEPRPAIWTCTVVHFGLDRDDLALSPTGCDQPMREAVHAAFAELTGHEPQGIASGWGQRYIPRAERAALEGENLLDDARHYDCWTLACQVVADHVGDEPGEDFTARRQRWDAAVSALCELLYDRGVGAVPA